MEKKDFQKMLDKQAEQLEQRIEKKFKDHVDTLKEDMDHRMDAIFEYVKDVPKIKEKVDLTFDKVGKMAVDIEILKETAHDHEQRIQVLEKV